MSFEASTVRRCAILFGTPVCREQYDRAARGEFVSDYMRGLLGDRAAPVAWDEDYRLVAEAAGQLIRCARSLGAGVYEMATLRDVADATRRYRYVVLLAHWRGVMFRADDLSGDIEPILERMRQDRTARTIAVASADRKGVIEALNHAVQSNALLGAFPPMVALAAKRTPGLGPTLCRDYLDEVLAGLVQPGNLVELFDGLHTVGKFESAIDAAFSGELDLALCQSIAAAMCLDLRRGTNVRHLHWAEYVLPAPQIVKVEWTLREMERSGGEYIATRLSVERGEPRKE